MQILYISGEAGASVSVFVEFSIHSAHSIAIFL